MTRKTRTVIEEIDQRMLEGAVIEEISRSRIVLRSKDGKCYHIYAVCYQCGDANLVVTESAPPQRG